MAQDTIEFKDDEDLKHLMQQAVADDFIRDYESSIKGGIRARKIYTWMSNIFSIAMLATSFVSGITAIVSDDPVVEMIAGIATLSVVPMERAKAYADNKFKEVTKNLAATYAKSGLNTFGAYDATDGPGRRIPPRGH